MIIPNIPAYDISSVSYDAATETTTVTTSKSNPFLVGNKVLFEDVLGTFKVVETTSATVFKVSGNVPSTPLTVYSVGLNSQVKDTNTTNEKYRVQTVFNC